MQHWEKHWAESGERASATSASREEMKEAHEEQLDCVSAFWFLFPTLSVSRYPFSPVLAFVSFLLSASSYFWLLCMTFFQEWELSELFHWTLFTKRESFFIVKKTGIGKYRCFFGFLNYLSWFIHSKIWLTICHLDHKFSNSWWIDKLITSPLLLLLFWANNQEKYSSGTTIIGKARTIFVSDGPQKNSRIVIKMQLLTGLLVQLVM